MSAMRCPAPEEFARALSEGASAELEEHLRRCPRCRRDWDTMGGLIQLGRRLPAVTLDDDEVEAAVLRLEAVSDLRARLPQRTQRWTWAVAAAAVVLLVVGVALRLRGPGRPELTSARRGAAHALGEARFVHAGEAGDEIVRLVDGAVLVEVSPLRPGERFRVLTGDGGEVEVRGTLFEVRARGDELAEVRVIQGRVEVRPPRRPPRRLGAGERWAADEGPPPSQDLAPTEAPASTPAAAPPRRRTRAPSGDGPGPSSPAIPAVPPEPKAAGTSAGPGAQDFAAAWTALRGGDFAAAAESFGRAEAAARGQPLAEDALYWQAVALARGGQKDRAARAMRDYLQRHGGAARAPEIGSMLGWLLLDARILDEAERRFRAAAATGRPEVQRSAREGLAAIEALRRAR